MGMTIDNSIRLLEDYHKWEKQFGLDGSGVDDATRTLIEVAKKYQKIQEIVEAWKADTDIDSYDSMTDIYEVVEDDNN